MVHCLDVSLRKLFFGKCNMKLFFTEPGSQDDSLDPNKVFNGFGCKDIPRNLVMQLTSTDTFRQYFFVFLKQVSTVPFLSASPSSV